MEDALQFQGWKKFRKKPVVIEAQVVDEIVRDGIVSTKTPDYVRIKNSKGEESIIDSKTFLRTYDPVDDA